MGPFVQELAALRQSLVVMGEDVVAMVTAATEALLSGDDDKAKAVIKNDKEINDKENEIVDRAIRLIATNQPVAGDLRFLAAALRLATELERIGDLGSNLARRTLGLAELAIEGAVIGPTPNDLSHMALASLNMLNLALKAFKESDSSGAEEVLTLDDGVDDYNRRIRKQILDHIYDNGRLAAWGLEIINTSAHLERLGDHATNLAEEVIYVTKGQNVRHNY
ncbi:MAG: phosphate signaling complex protein PhoU [Deltaproteobacteria bacterium]|jgi:phosphate transport system protein|nr:phosphate signaling complex protein PhoU [Deltaproteobacteria bacterium]